MTTTIVLEIVQQINNMALKFFLYDLLYTSFSSFKTEYIYDKQYNDCQMFVWDILYS